MLSREGLLQGGESDEPALIPGDAAASPLYQAANWDGLEMPPKENDRLNAEQLADLKQWIDGGAEWPTVEQIDQILRTTADKWNQDDGVMIATSGGLSEEWTNRKYKPEDLWAYQPLWQDDRNILRPDTNPIDQLIDARLNELNIAPAKTADRRTLIRRMTYDLTGLPPTPKEITDFLADPRDDQQAINSLTERLLSSPHYGERWAQHWLDVVRYADTSGLANDFDRGNAWRYRDYVVRSFNEDKPYDQFVREQIAGDEIDESDPELLIASGFLRMGPWELTGMEVAKVARQRFLDDVTDAVGQVFLGHMLQCARCHDHKFDPVPTRDYYAMQAIFSMTQLADRRAEFLPKENQANFDEANYLKRRQKYFKSRLAEVNKKETLKAARAWFEEQGREPAEFERTVLELTQNESAPSLEAVRTAMAKRDVPADLIPPKKSGFEPKDFGIERICRKEAQRLAWRLDRYRPFALAVYSGKTRKLHSVSSPLRLPKDRQQGELEETAILTGGDPFSPSQKVAPGMLSAVGLPFQATDTIAGRRTQLADWITSRQNPLTARVMVNRIWQWHFGTPLAGNPNNFGGTGKKPTHPRLLDYLAQRFMDQGWSVKSIHRLILSSKTYRRSTAHPQPKQLAQLDPNGTGYARFATRRLTAEELRDTMLSCSGELNLEVGGIPVRPEMNMEAALQPRMVMGSFAEAWQPSTTPAQRHRRSLYAMRVRGLRDPFLEVFNSPSSEISCEAREASMVTPQVFAMFNSESSFDRALAMANRVTQEFAELSLSKEAREEKIMQRIFQLAYGRDADKREQEACAEHWRTMTERHNSLQFEKPDYPTQIVRQAIEENTGVEFEYTEPLEMYEEFVPDLKPADASPKLRGLAELCLVIFNSNEFAYVH